MRFELFCFERIAASVPAARFPSRILHRGEARAYAEAWIGPDWFDYVLRTAIRRSRLEESFPLAANGQVAVCYTGYVTSAGAPPPRAPRGEQHEVVVSAGGGSTGSHVLHAAIAARPFSSLRELCWRILVGPGIPEDDFRALAAAAGPGIVVERNRPDFPALLARARVSISQGGYNTMMDLVRSSVHAVVVPFEHRAETEQRVRALPAARGAIELRRAGA
jgi:predicted glycosyltransferase